MRARAALLACLLLVLPVMAQQNTADAPATKEEVERYFAVMHVRETVQTVMDTMTKQMRPIAREQWQKNSANLPPDFEQKMDRMMDDLLKGIPLDQMFDAMVPVYQKHLTKGDLDAIVAFYSTPTGQKLLREMPAMTQEAMQAVMPIVQKQMSNMQERVQAEVAEMVKQAKDKQQPQHP